MKALLFPSDKRYVVQCIEYDIASQGDTAEKAIESFYDTFLAECKFSKGDLSQVPLAPASFWNANVQAKSKYRKTIKVKYNKGIWIIDIFELKIKPKFKNK
jgi:hypothetical protein